MTCASAVIHHNILGIGMGTLCELIEQTSVNFYIFLHT